MADGVEVLRQERDRLEHCSRPRARLKLQAALAKVERALEQHHELHWSKDEQIARDELTLLLGGGYGEEYEHGFGPDADLDAIRTALERVSALRALYPKSWRAQPEHLKAQADKMRRALPAPAKTSPDGLLLPGVA